MGNQNNTKKKKVKLDWGKLVPAIIIVIGAVVFIVSAVMLITIQARYKKGNDTYEDVANEVFETETDDSGKTVPEKFVWNFDKLLAINPDAKGYLRQQGELKNRVDYPVVQGRDNSYYLKHLIDGTANNSGTLFIDARIKDGFEAQNCIIYGHNMHNEAMFGCLSDYEDENFFKIHPAFDVYIGEDHYLYNIFARGVVSTSSFAYQYEFSGTSDFMNFISNALALNDFNTGYDISDFNEDSKILTLSTCLDVYDEEYRFVVFLVRDRKLVN